MRSTTYSTRVAQVFAWLTCSILLASCAPTGLMKVSPEEEAYLKKTREVPLKLSVPAAEADDVWARAQSFVATYSDLPLAISTDYIIQTSSAGDTPNISYRLTRLIRGDQAEIKIECGTGNMFAVRQIPHNAHILAHYLLTGELPYPRLIR